MSTTPADFEPPEFEDEDTKKVLLRRVSKLERIEERRTGSLTVITYLLGILILGGTSFFAWLTLTLTGVEGDVRSLTADVHARLDGQQHSIDQLERKIDRN